MFLFNTNSRWSIFLIHVIIFTDDYITTTKAKRPKIPSVKSAVSTGNQSFSLFSFMTFDSLYQAIFCIVEVYDMWFAQIEIKGIALE